MARTGGHKALVPVTDAEWRAFRAIAVDAGTTIADALAELVRQTLRRAGRDDVVEQQVPAPIAGQLALEDGPRGARTAAKARRRAKAAPAKARTAKAKAPAKARKRSAGERFGGKERPTG